MRYQAEANTQGYKTNRELIQKEIFNLSTDAVLLYYYY